LPLLPFCCWFIMKSCIIWASISGVTSTTFPLPPFPPPPPPPSSSPPPSSPPPPPQMLANNLPTG
jgi:hypothetical protein